MTIELGTTDINKVLLGSTNINKIYLGSNAIFDKTSTPVVEKSWQSVGSLLSVPQPPGRYGTLSKNRTAISFAGTEDNIKVFDYIDGTWSQVGNTFTGFSNKVSNSDYIDAMSATRLAYYTEEGPGINQTFLYALSWDGTNIAIEGNGLDLGFISTGYIVGLTSTRIAFCDSGSLSTYDFDGTNWSLVGNTLSGTPVTTTAIKLNEKTIIVHESAGSSNPEYLVTYEFDGTDWSQVGSKYTIRTPTYTNGAFSVRNLIKIDENNIGLIQGVGATDREIDILNYNSGVITLERTQNTGLTDLETSTLGNLGTGHFVMRDNTVTSIRKWEYSEGVLNSGEWLAIVGRGSGKINHYENNTGTSFNINNFSHVTGGTYDTSLEDSVPNGYVVSLDGTKAIMGGNSNILFRYDYSTAFDSTTISYSGTSLNLGTLVGGTINNCKSLRAKPDGTVLYVADSGTGDIHQINLSTPWDLSTATYGGFVDVSTREGNIQGIDFNATGSKMLMVGSFEDRIDQYVLSTDWDITTATYDSKTYSIPTSLTGGPAGVTWDDNEEKVYICGIDGGGNSQVFELVLSTAGDISSASDTTRKLNVNAQENNIQDIYLVK